MDHNRTLYTKSAKETQSIGKDLAQSLVDQIRRGVMSLPLIYCLSGDLGSGKTTFAQGFARGLGITTRLLSPTFIIVRRYEIPQTALWFYHLDLYRVEHEKELETLGIREILQNPHNIIAIEWAEKFGGYLPHSRIDIKFSVHSDGSHSIGITELTQLT